MKKRCLTILCILLVAALATCSFGCRKNKTIEEMDMLQEALDIIDRYYMGDAGVDELDYIAATAILNNLDQFTYVSDVEYSQVSASNIGITVTTTKYNEYIVTSVTKGLPADTTFEDGFHIERGDEIYGLTNSNKVDEDGNPIFYRLRGLSNVRFASYTEGDAGTKLTLRIVRDGEMKDYTYTKADAYIPRADFVADVFGEGTGVGYIALSSFNYYEMPDGTRKSAGEDFRACMDAFREAGQTKLVLDLRGNGGGRTDILAEVASYFVPLGSTGVTEILRLKYAKTGDMTQVNVKLNNYIADLPLVILCDAHTASAAEGLIGACRAYNKVNTTVIGTDTYGKGVFQRSDIVLKDENESSRATGVPDTYYVTMVAGYYYIVDPSVEGGEYNIHNKPLSPDQYVTANETIGALVDDAEMIAARKALLGE